MSKRVTILLDDDMHRKLRLVQSKLMSKSAASVSFSSVLNKTVAKGLK